MNIHIYLLHLNNNLEKIYHLFIKLRLLLTNPENITETSSPSSIFNELTNICIHLINEENYNLTNSIDIFEIILKNYILLLDLEFQDKTEAQLEHHEPKSIIIKKR